VDIARRRFTFLDDSRATIEVALGDARLSLQREAPQQFDVLAVDAFSSDAIPVHLITTEAIAVYLRHLQADGVFAFHVTNRYLKLAPVVEQLARAHGLHATLVSDSPGATDFRYASDWVLVSRRDDLAGDERIGPAATRIEAVPGLRLWTDDYNNLLDILK
jgi:spermidine synthase